MSKSCHICTRPDDLRPYGPKGEWVCFSCAMSTPERRRATEQQFAAQMAAIDGPVVIGEEVGPYPAAHDPRFAGRVQHE